MKIQDLFETCSTITKDHGFDVSKHTLQLLLMASEIAEALEEVTSIGQSYEFQKILMLLMRDFENFRKYSNNPTFDDSKIINIEHYLEEIADLQIRIASYIEGNNLTEQFIEALNKKIEVNKNRPHLHGKGF